MIRAVSPAGSCTGWRESFANVHPLAPEGFDGGRAIRAAFLVVGVTRWFTVGDLREQQFDIDAAGKLFGISAHRHVAVCLRIARRARWIRPLTAGTLVLSTSASRS